VTDLSIRSRDPEWMETETVPAEDFARCLGDLAVVNRVTFAHRPTLAWLARAVGGATEFSVLDVGFGEGDMLRAIARWAARHGKRPTLSGVDLDPYSALAARSKTPAGIAIEYHTGDVFAFAPASRPDFIISSLFTHHLSDAQVVAFLRWMEATAGRGWFVNDLHRHTIAYHGFRAMAAVAGWHRFVRHDGPVSIARAFRRADWQRYLAEAGVPGTIAWRFPFRFCVERLR
jgi:2-polyprenyl-3-methyl-5-hydroxy-6-metoxy-1,4-benzoquinol methylase